VMPEAERPKVFVTASAVGFYGERGEERLTEESASGLGFLAEMCEAESLGLRAVAVWSGVVLPPFKLGLGGPLGSGSSTSRGWRWMTWCGSTSTCW